MELKVRALDEVQEKSVQEIEQELLDKAQQQNETVQQEVEQVQEEVQVDDTSSEGFGENDVLTYLKNRYNKEISSIDELFEQKESNQELPEDVSAFLDYKKKTGRGISDYVKLNRDFDDMADDQLLTEYFKSTEDGLDEEDIQIMMDDYSYDEELDDETEIKKIRLKKKKTVAKAKKYFNEQKEMYKQPLESSPAGISQSEMEEVEAALQYIKQSKSYEEELGRKREVFVNQTNSFFDNNFKGFDFKVGEKEIVYNPGDTQSLKKAQLDSSNFMKKYVDENNVITDVSGYHKAMAVAMNPEKFARFFYEQGQADATDNVTRKIKNIQMDERKAPEVTNKGGVQIRSVNSDSGRGLKIKSRK